MAARNRGFRNSGAECNTRSGRMGAELAAGPWCRMTRVRGPCLAPDRDIL